MEALKNKISSTLKEGVVTLLKTPPGHKKPKNTSGLTHIKTQIVRLYSKERVVEVQRQHVVSLLIPVFINLSLIIVALFSVLSLHLQNFFKIPEVILIELFFVIFCFFLTLTVFALMYWYYQFYIITNRCLIHRHFFRIGGYHSEELFLETSPEREIITQASNPIYSLFGIDDVYVLFQRPGLKEFVFKTPENANRVENALEEISLEHEEGKTR